VTLVVVMVTEKVWRINPKIGLFLGFLFYKKIKINIS
jgi:hypothetical protein